MVVLEENACLIEDTEFMLVFRILMAITRGRGSFTGRSRGRGSQGGMQHDSDSSEFEIRDGRPVTSQQPHDRNATSSLHDVDESLDDSPNADRPHADRPRTDYCNINKQHDARVPIYVDRVDGGVLRRFRPHSVTGEVMRNVMNRLPSFAPRWRSYPCDMKDALYAEFQAKYKFMLPEDEAIGRSVWDKMCQDRYSDNMCNLRKAGLRHNNTEDLAQTKSHPPRGMRVEVWDQFVDYWLSDGFKKRSESAKANRILFPNAPLHTGGSISFVEHKRKMEEEQEGEISMKDVYVHTHKKKGTDEFIFERARQFVSYSLIHERLDAGLERKYGEDRS